MKFLSFPFLVQQHVLRQLDPQEVVLLSFCSARMRRKVEKELRQSLIVLEFEYTTKEKFIRLNRKIDIKSLEWCLDPIGLSREERKSPKRFCIKNASDTHYCSIYEDNSGLISCKIDIENVGRMIQYLKGLFQIAPLELNIDTENITKLKKLLTDPVYQQLKTFHFSGLYITGRKLSSIFDSMPVQNRAVVTIERIHGPVDKRCKVFKANSLFFKDSRWLTREHLLSLESVKTAIFRNVELSTDDLIAFVKHWRDGGNTKLVAFVFYTDRVAMSVTWNINAIVTEMGAQPWNRKQRKCYFKFDGELDFHHKKAEGRIAMSPSVYKNTRTAFDFERSDGLLASILGNEWVFGLIVWHDRFPKYPRDWPE